MVHAAPSNGVLKTIIKALDAVEHDIVYLRAQVASLAKFELLLYLISELSKLGPSFQEHFEELDLVGVRQIVGHIERFIFLFWSRQGKQHGHHRVKRDRDPIALIASYSALVLTVE